jgi:site-specific DNA-methyltransferase (adenine-specific)
MLPINTIVQGNALDVLRTFPAECVDLVMTSPPYADSRKHSYAGIRPQEYVDWFLPISHQLYRVLKPDGSFVLNIKERVVGGERSTYVVELLLALRRQGWLWTDEYIWHKKNCYPGKWPNRFRDAWERCYHFTKQRTFRMYQEAVMVPATEATIRRSVSQAAKDCFVQQSKTGSGLSRCMATCLGRDSVYPSNVLHLATECHNRQHSAAYPIELPAWFIKLLTKEGDIVPDPFIGSGTTAVAALKFNRRYLGVELNPGFARVAKERLTNNLGDDRVAA